MNTKEDATIEIDLKQLLNLAVARLRLIIFVVFVFTLSAYLISKFVMTPMYTATATMYVNNNKTTVSQNISISDIDTGRELVSLYSEFIESDTVLEQVAAAVSGELDAAIDAKTIRSMVTSGGVNDTALMAVSVTSPSPQVSQIIANAVADIAPDRITEFMDASSVKVVDYAKMPEYASSPNVLKNTVVGFMAGIFVSFAIILLMEITDTRVKSEDDLKKLLEYPVIGIIPEIIVDEEEAVAQ